MVNFKAIPQYFYTSKITSKWLCIYIEKNYDCFSMDQSETPERLRGESRLSKPVQTGNSTPELVSLTQKRQPGQFCSAIKRKIPVLQTNVQSSTAISHSYVVLADSQHFYPT